MKRIKFISTILLAFLGINMAAFAEDNETQIVTIDGLNYNLAGRNESHPFAYLTDVSPSGKIMKYKGDITVPYNIEYEGTKYIVSWIENEERIFTHIPDLTSLTLNCMNRVNVVDAPDLKFIRCNMSGVNQVSGCPALETIFMSENVEYIGTTVSECPALRKIYIDNENVTTMNDIFSEVQAPLDVYMKAECLVKPDEYKYSNRFPGDSGIVFTSNPNVTFHVKEGMKDVFECSAWKGWNFIEDMGPFRNQTEFSYSGHGYGTGGGYAIGVGDNNAELAFRIPKSLAKDYAGNRITSINFNSIGIHWNEINGETYDYVFITESGKDYVLKKDIETLRGVFNRIDLGDGYEITGETDIYVGFGSKSVIEWGSSQGVEKTTDGIFFRLMGDNYHPFYQHGKWYEEIDGESYGTFNCECTISGDNIKKDVKIHSLKINRNDLDIKNPDLFVREEEDDEEWDEKESSLKKIVHVDAGKPFDISFKVHSNTPGVIKSLGFVCQVDGETIETKKADIVLPNNSDIEVSFSLPSFEITGEHEIILSCVDIDGSVDAISSNSTRAKDLFIRNVEKTFPRNSLIETVECDNNKDLTRDFIENRIPANNIVVSAHVWDDLAPSYNYYDGVLEDNGQLRPKVNREFSTALCEYLDIKEDESAPAQILIGNLHFLDEEKTKVKVETETEFGFDSSEEFRISYLVVEDNVDYEGNIHNGLVRGCLGTFNGTSSFPKDGVKEGEKYTNGITFDISDFSIADKDNLKIVAVLIDGEYNTVINSYVSPLKEVKIPEINIGNHRIVMEGVTATNCGWCTREMAAIDDISIDYPDNILPIMIHSDDWGDPMANSIGFEEILSRASSIPWSILDRKCEIDPTPEKVRQYMEENYNHAEAVIEIESAYIDRDNNIQVESVIDLLPRPIENYHVAYVLTEDELGPYMQKNSYNGGQHGTMGGYENKESVFSCMYDNVARACYDEPVDDALITSYKDSGVTRAYSGVLSLPDNIDNVKNVKVTALLIENADGHVVNASRKPLKFSDSGLTNTDIPRDIKIRCNGKTIEISGLASDTHISLHSIGGILVSDKICKGPAITITVPEAGIYILNVNGQSYKMVF